MWRFTKGHLQSVPHNAFTFSCNNPKYRLWQTNKQTNLDVQVFVQYLTLLKLKYANKI